VKTCILPTVEGVIYSYEGSNKILYPGALINRHLKVVENCEVGYHKAHSIGFRFCLGKGNWLSSSDKLCFSKFCIVNYVYTYRVYVYIIVYSNFVIIIYLIIHYT